MFDMIKYKKIFTRPKSKIFFVLIFLTAVLVLFIFKLVQSYVFDSSIARYKLVQPAKHKFSDTKIILFWTNFFEFSNWGMPNATNYEDYLKSINCPVTNCILTHDKKYLNSPHLYDALVFHGAESWKMVNLPETRSPHQLYVLALLE